jgi:hypothetical protein
MATSIFIVGNRHQMFKDLDLIAIVCLLEDKVQSTRPNYDAMLSWISQWQEDLRYYGPGTIDLQLEQLMAVPEAGVQLISLLSAVHDDLRQSGGTVPAPVLQNRCKAPGIIFRDYPVDLLMSAIERLMILLKQP